MLRKTVQKPLLYWIIGTVLIWSLLPLSAIDIMIAPRWHAPHWQCDSLGIVIFNTLFGLIPWAIISAVISVLLTFPMTRHRVGGADIFDKSLGSGWRKWIISILIAVVIGFEVWEILRHLWAASFVQTITADCGGNADPIQVEMRGPLVQLLPFFGIPFSLWLLHLRALALSPRCKT